jgi:hypothetical protein
MSERHSAWVGTAHYMAPEVGKGQYGRSIDVYACGVVLYEMLTGRPPFDGESEHEIMMRHATDEVDMAPVPAAFRAVVAKGLAKNPSDRYAGVTEFARAVDAVPIGGSTAAEPVVMTVAGVIDPGKPAGVTDPGYRPPTAAPLPVAAPLPRATPVPPAAPVTRLKPAAAPFPYGERLGDLAAALGKAPLVAAVALIPWLVFAQGTAWADVGKVLLLAVAVVWGVLLATFGAKYSVKDEWGRRFRLALAGSAVGLFCFWLDGQHMPEFDPSGEETAKAETYLFGAVRMAPGTMSVLSGYALYFAATLGLVRWWHSTARDRKEKFSVWPLFVALIFGCLFQFLWQAQQNGNGVGKSGMVFGVVPLVVAAAAVQIVSPWAAPEAALAKRKQRCAVA